MLVLSDGLAPYAAHRVGQLAALQLLGSKYIQLAGAGVVDVVVAVRRYGLVVAEEVLAFVVAAHGSRAPAVGQRALGTACPSGDGSALASALDGTRYIAVGDYEGGIATHVHTDDTGCVGTACDGGSLEAQTIHRHGAVGAAHATADDAGVAVGGLDLAVLAEDEVLHRGTAVGVAYQTGVGTAADLQVVDGVALSVECAGVGYIASVADTHEQCVVSVGHRDVVLQEGVQARLLLIGYLVAEPCEFVTVG